ncbi:MAG TPA: right-handed parallel beta-helix repeat-containing protein [Actinomycetota bacterium]|nr:right-handed parallel beta-helix repeat-containing protein [Actinomycetota bacterium]
MLKRVIITAFVVTGTITAVLGSGTASAARRPCDVHIEAPADLNQRFRKEPVGAVICVSGTFRIDSSLEPRDGQVIRGHATIVNAGGVEDGFYLAQAEDVKIAGLEIMGFNTRGVRCGAGTRLVRSVLHHNAQNGVGCNLDNRAGSHIIIAHNQVYANGDPSIEGNTSGGMKFVRSGLPGARPGNSVSVRHNEVWGNIGNGIWFDINSAGDLIARNEVWDNTRSGIRYEISAGPGMIRRNVTHGNAWYGIWITSSAKVVVRENIAVRNGKKDIIVISDERARLTFPELGGTHDGYKIVNIDVAGNTVAREVAGCSLDGVSC